MSLAGQLQTAMTRIATEFKTIRTEMAAIGGGTAVKASALPSITGQTVALLDQLIIRDISNPSQDATNGSLSEATLIEAWASVRKALTNQSVSSQTGFATDTYLVGSDVPFPAGMPIVGTTYRLIFDVTKTNVGTAAPTITIRIGTAGSTADSARCTIAFGAGTAAVDSGLFEVICDFRTVGGSTSAVLQAVSRLTSNLTTTGLSNAVKAKPVTSSGFDSTVGSSRIGASYNGGTSAAHTIQLVRAELIP